MNNNSVNFKKKSLLSAAVAGLIAAGALAQPLTASADETEEATTETHTKKKTSTHVEKHSCKGKASAHAEKNGCGGKDGCNTKKKVTSKVEEHEETKEKSE